MVLQPLRRHHAAARLHRRRQHRGRDVVLLRVRQRNVVHQVETLQPMERRQAAPHRPGHRFGAAVQPTRRVHTEMMQISAARAAREGKDVTCERLIGGSPLVDTVNFMKNEGGQTEADGARSRSKNRFENIEWQFMWAHNAWISNCASRPSAATSPDGPSLPHSSAGAALLAPSNEELYRQRFITFRKRSLYGDRAADSNRNSIAPLPAAVAVFDPLTPIRCMFSS